MLASPSTVWLTSLQIAIMNASSVMGRALPNFAADTIGNFNLILCMASACSALIFSMFHLQSAGAVITFSILYGFFSGACGSNVLCLHYDVHSKLYLTVISLLPPTIAVLARGIHEIGCAFTSVE